MNLGPHSRFRSLTVIALGALAVCWPCSAVRAGEHTPILVQARELHVGSGKIIPDGRLLIVDGRISAVGRDLKAPAGATVIEVAKGSITPGLIDAHASVESANIMTPASRSSSAIIHDFFCPKHGAEPIKGCCGSACRKVYNHVAGTRCDVCGFPDAETLEALGTRTWSSTAEQASEVIPHTRVIDSVNLRSPDFDRLLAGGVTTVFVAPDSASVIGAQGAIVHTGGPLSDRIVQEAGAVKAAMGTDSFRRGGGNRRPFRSFVDFRTRRPTTRMGVTWVFRKAFYDARRFDLGVKVSGADAPSEPALAVLSRILQGDVPLRIQARRQFDILTAIRLAAEFDLSFILEEATEAHLCLDEIKAVGVPVVYGPIFVEPTGYRAFSTETDRARLHTMKALLDADITVALTANDLRDEDGLARQAMYALRYDVKLDQVMRSVTQTPAKLLGLDYRMGTLEKGKEADLVIWSGRPFDATTKPVVVMIAGKVVLDRRQS